MTNVIDWILNLFRDEASAQAFLNDPDRAMCSAGVQNVSAAQLQHAAATVAPVALAHGGGDPVVGLQHAVAKSHGFAFVPQHQTEVLSDNDFLSHNDTRVLSPETNIDKSVDIEFGDITFGDKTTNTATNGGVVVDGDNDGDILTDGSVKQEGDDNVANTGDIETGDGSPVVVGNDNDVENSNQQAGDDIIADNEGPVVNDTNVGGGGDASGGNGGGGILGGGDGGDATGGSGGVLVIEDNDTTTTDTGGGDITNVETGGGDISGGVDASHDDNSSNSHNTDNSTHDSHDQVDNSVDNSIDQGNVDIF
jgi:hypothetical protein